MPFKRSGVLFLLKTPREGGTCIYEEKPQLPILSMIRLLTVKNTLNKGGNL